jgi:multidrug resistance efflux pump
MFFSAIRVCRLRLTETFDPMNASVPRRIDDRRAELGGGTVVAMHDPLAEVEEIVRNLDARVPLGDGIVQRGDDAVEITYLRFRRVPTPQTARFVVANADIEPMSRAEPPRERPGAAAQSRAAPCRSDDLDDGDTWDDFSPEPTHARAGAGRRVDARSAGGDKAKSTSRVGGGRGRLLRGGIALGIIGVAIAFGVNRFVLSARSPAMLTAVQITLRAPIDGTLSRAAAQVGDLLDPGAAYASLDNDRADRARLTDLTAAVKVAEAEVRSLEARLADTAAMATDARRSAANFRATRATQLTARLAESDANVAASAARFREADAALRRIDVLYQQGVVAAAGLDQARRAYDVSRADVYANTQKRASAQAELNAVRGGVFASDNASDRSISQQNELQMHSQSRDTEALLDEKRARLAGLKAQLASEQSRLGRVEHTALSVPARARLLNVLAQPGEYVRQGQDIAAFLDCAQPIVTADVAESVYRDIQIGQTATFSGGDSSADYSGRVVEKSSTPASVAAGTQPTYKVTVRIGGSWGKRFCESALGWVRFSS